MGGILFPGMWNLSDLALFFLDEKHTALMLDMMAKPGISHKFVKALEGEHGIDLLNMPLVPFQVFDGRVQSFFNNFQPY